MVNQTIFLAATVATKIPVWHVISQIKMHVYEIQANVGMTIQDLKTPKF